ncbi:MAG TPA: hypothetical protein VFW96_27550 [Thermomicrobiales bacterium]|nr:hypothetical protein [Thermomicrobiales bacterium]
MPRHETTPDLAFADCVDRFGDWERREAASAAVAREALDATRAVLTPVAGALLTATEARARGALDEAALAGAVWRAVVTAFCAGWGAGLAAAERDAGDDEG